MYAIESESYISTVPHLGEFDLWRARLSDAEYRAIAANLNARIDGSEIHTSSWMPGADWSSTVFQPIYEKACRRNQESAAKFFGLILWAVLLERDDVWAFGRYEKDGMPIAGMTYFRLSASP